MDTAEKPIISKEDMRFAIVGKDERELTISVTYWAAGFTFLMTHNLRLYVDPETNCILSGQALKDYIMDHAPTEAMLNKIERYKAAVSTDFSEIDRLIASGANKIP